MYLSIWVRPCSNTECQDCRLQNAAMCLAVMLSRAAVWEQSWSCLESSQSCEKIVTGSHRGYLRKFRQNCLKKEKYTGTCKFLKDQLVWRVPTSVYYYYETALQSLFSKFIAAFDRQKSTGHFFFPAFRNPHSDILHSICAQHL